MSGDARSESPSLPTDRYWSPTTAQNPSGASVTLESKTAKNASICNVLGKMPAERRPASSQETTVNPTDLSPDADVRAPAQTPRDLGHTLRPARYMPHPWSPIGRRLASPLRMVGVGRIRYRAAILPPPDDHEG